MGRVGRNNDPCKRLKVIEIDLVSENQKIAYHAHLMEYYRNNAAKTFRVAKSKGNK